MDKNKSYGVTEILVEASKSKDNKDYLTALNKYNEALFFLEGEDKINALFSIADLYSEMDNYKDALKVYNDILELDDNNSGAWYGVAYTNELSGGDIGFTLEAYEKAIEFDPLYKEAYYFASVIYGDKGELVKAKDYLEKVIELDPEDFIAYNDLGAIYEYWGDYETASTYLKKSIDINANYYLSHFNLGVVYKAMGNYEKAIEKYIKSAELSENNRNPYLNMSALYIEINQLEKAEEILTKGLKKLQDHILYYNRACVYRKKGNMELALEDFNIAKKINPIVLKWANNDPDLMDIVTEE